MAAVAERAAPARREWLVETLFGVVDRLRQELSLVRGRPNRRADR